MSIRTKIILIVIPLILAPLLITGYVASLTARNGITRVVTSLLQFKEEELLSYAGSQWALLTDNGLAGNPKFLGATKTAIEAFARNMIRSDSEVILAVDGKAGIAMSTSSLAFSSDEAAAFAGLIADKRLGWRQLRLGGVDRVCQIAAFPPFEWYFLVTERRSTFYEAVNELYRSTALIVAVSLVAALSLLLGFSFIIIKPLRSMVGTIKDIMRRATSIRKSRSGIGTKPASWDIPSTG